MLKSKYTILLSIIFGLFFLALLNAKRVPTADMHPSIQKDDLIWIRSAPPQLGSVVLLQDPHDSERVYLRRVMAMAGDAVQALPNGALRINGKTIRQRDMGTVDLFRIYQENIWSTENKALQYLVQRLIEAPQAMPQSPQVLPPKTLYVMSDNRDVAVDSRWWGPISEDLVLGVVALRIGAAHEWRDYWSTQP